MRTWTEDKTIELSAIIGELQDALQSIADNAKKIADHWIEQFDEATCLAHPITKNSLEYLRVIAQFICGQPARTENLLFELSAALKSQSEDFKGLLKGKKIEDLPSHHLLLLRNMESNVLNQINNVVQETVGKATAGISKTKRTERNADLSDGFVVAKNVTLTALTTALGVKDFYLLYEAGEMARDVFKRRNSKEQIGKAVAALDLQSAMLFDLLKICSTLHQIPNRNDLKGKISIVNEVEAKDRLRSLMPENIRGCM